MRKPESPRVGVHAAAGGSFHCATTHPSMYVRPQTSIIVRARVYQSNAGVYRHVVLTQSNREFLLSYTSISTESICNTPIYSAVGGLKSFYRKTARSKCLHHVRKKYSALKTWKGSPLVVGWITVSNFRDHSHCRWAKIVDSHQDQIDAFSQISL